MGFLKEFFERVDFEKKSADENKNYSQGKELMRVKKKLLRRQRVNESGIFFLHGSQVLALTVVPSKSDSDAMFCL